MPHIETWIHMVWATKRRYPFLNDEIRKDVFDHIKSNAFEKKIHLDFIGGYFEHLHALISLSATQHIENVAKLLKGESSHWINKNRLTKHKFGWQDEYFAASVSPGGVPSVRRYIANQEEHHSKVTFEEEYEEFLRRAIVRG